VGVLVSVCDAVSDGVKVSVSDGVRLGVNVMVGDAVAVATTTAQISRQPLNADMADGVLNSFRAPRPHLRSRITIEQVLAVAADYHHIHVEDLVGPRRTARLNQARQIAMYLAREIGMCSLVQIGDAFGGRSHSTVLHSCNKVETDLPYDEFLRRDVEAIQRELLGR